jgi:hypothetical protein
MHMTEDDFKKEHHTARRYDPILAAWTNSPSVTKAFLKNGESLTRVQRAGVVVISLTIAGTGLNLGFDAIDAFRAGSSSIFISALPSIFLLVFGMLGLRNALRPKKRKPED